MASPSPHHARNSRRAPRHASHRRAYGLLWHYFSPATLEWHALATLATWMMTLIIQRSAHRDTEAIHAKLDELLRSHPEARTELAELDDEEPEDIEEFRRRSRKE